MVLGRFPDPSPSIVCVRVSGNSAQTCEVINHRKPEAEFLDVIGTKV
jgi:hypothetical protein